MAKTYLFKRAADSQWIFGPNVDCECPAGIFRCLPSDNRAAITIESIERGINKTEFNAPITNFFKENGSAYASFAELKAGYSGFFVNALAVASGGMGRTRITGNGGTDYAIPANLNPSGSVDAFSSIELDVSIAIVAELPVLRFGRVLEVNESVLVFYEII